MSVTIGAPVAPERSSAPLDLLRRELTGEVHIPPPYTRTTTV